MSKCNWCQTSITQDSAHTNFMGAYTCNKKQQITPKITAHQNSQFGRPNQKKKQAVTAPIGSRHWSNQSPSTTTLYHQTSEQNATSILKERKMKPGSNGMAGSAIYFATTPGDTHHKAQNTGVILKCEVELGKVKKVAYDGDYSLDAQKLSQEGYDSVTIPREAGKEYAVYDSKKVKQITIHQKTGNNHHRYSAGQPRGWY